MGIVCSDFEQLANAPDTPEWKKSVELNNPIVEVKTGLTGWASNHSDAIQACKNYDYTFMPADSRVFVFEERLLRQSRVFIVSSSFEPSLQPSVWQPNTFTPYVIEQFPNIITPFVSFGPGSALRRWHVRGPDDSWHYGFHQDSNDTCIEWIRLNPEYVENTHNFARLLEL